MKKWIVLTTLLLSACTPQVTVTSEVTVTSTPLPTETPIPTQTLNPTFVEIQKKIESAGTRFTLNGADGLIYDGETPIQGLSVAPDGKMTLTVDGESIALELSDVTFDNEEGVIINGYETDKNGIWVEEMSPAEKQLSADVAKWNVDISKYDVSIGIDETIILRDKEIGKVIYKNGNWEVFFLGELIREQKMCKVTPWVGSKIGPNIPPDIKAYTTQYLQPLGDYYQALVKNKVISSAGMRSTTFYFGNQCWGQSFYVYKDQPSAWLFWKDTNGYPLYEKVFQAEN